MKKELPERFKSYKHVWVFIEFEHGQIHPVSLELLGEGRKLADKLNCELAGVLLGGDKAQLQEAAETFTTPLDLRVRAALHAAVEQKGIVTADFPADVRDDVRQFAGPGLWHDESPICLPRQQASANPVR